MTVVNPNAAGIDVGDTIHAVAAPSDRDSESVRVLNPSSSSIWFNIEKPILEQRGINIIIH